ncbi:hypothetical protein CASFOL_022698 [Castilleja foliolosa]|uniref:Ycf15 n=1 Tax=Castilleja foliolosa TaxID=1961234 RepID=A0ABD3CV89_9LAMI
MENLQKPIDGNRWAQAIDSHRWKFREWEKEASIGLSYRFPSMGKPVSEAEKAQLGFIKSYSPKKRRTQHHTPFLGLRTDLLPQNSSWSLTTSKSPSLSELDNLRIIIHP